MTLLAQFAATGGAGAANYIEDVFSTWLYTGNGSTQTITNGVDLAGKGGLTIGKIRNLAGGPFQWYDTARGATKVLESSSTAAQTTVADGVTAFNSNGITIGANSNINFNTYNFVNWTFREQAKFFDVVTYTGNAVSGRTVAHNLGSVPGCIIIKRTDSASDWAVMARRSGFTSSYATGLKLNATNARTNDYDYTIGSDISSTVFPVFIDPDSGLNAYNVNGATYVAYLFAHNAGGFGLTGTDNVISCGSFTTDGSANATVTLGYEPQWVMWKSSTASDQWQISDTMRGWSNSSGGRAWLRANAADAETVGGDGFPTATGFEARSLSGSQTYIYIAIRRGPMKVPTTGTSVYYAQATQDVNTSFQTGFPVDMVIDRYGFWNDSQVPQTGSFYVYDRLRGSPRNLVTNTTAAETSSQPSFFVATTGFQSNTRLGVGPGDGSLGNNYAFFWNFRRAPGFFDEVCYTGTGVARTVAHNLTVVPELMIVKKRDGANGWAVYSNSLPTNQFLELNNTGGPYTATTVWNNTAPTLSVFTVGTDSGVNSSGGTYVNYLFASAPGVSKVGSYTGTATTQVINCGFTGGARFVLIRRIDSTGDWYVWDSARGIVAGNDPYLLLNSTAAEVTSTDYVDTAASGFELTATAPAAINASGGTFIFWAIA